MNRKNARLYVWLKTQRKYKNLQKRLVTLQGEINGRFLRKLELLKKRLFDLNRKWKLGISTAVMTGWMAATPAVAQKKFPSNLNVSTLDGTNGFILNGENINDNSGYSVSTAGDFNGDGVDDIIIGAPRADPNGLDLAGKTYVVFGNKDGFEKSLDLSALSGTNGFSIDGIEAYNPSNIPATSGFLGGEVNPAGDLNGDGIDDIIISSSRTSNGKVYVLFGQKNWSSATFDLKSFESDLGARTKENTIGFAVTGESQGDNLGIYTDKLGDVNGDGLDDIIIGANKADTEQSNAGKSYVIFGSKNEFATSYSLASLNGSTGFVIEGINADDLAGVVGGAGDINSDGLNDIIIGASGASPNEKNGAGQSYVIFGSEADFAATIKLSDLNGSNGFAMNGIASGNSVFDVSTAGDINGDGFDDIMIGAAMADPNSKGESGEAYVVFGKKDNFASSFELSTLDGTNGFILEGESGYDYAGHSLSDIGDINADGLDDIIISSKNNVKDYVIYGNKDGFISPFNLSKIDGTNGFTVESPLHSENTVGKSGDFNGDGVQDLIIGSQGGSPGDPAVSDAGLTQVIFGLKNNTPTVANALADLSLDEGFSTKTVDISKTFSDSDTDALTLNAVSSDETIVMAAVDGTTLTLTEVGTGTATITVTADDGNVNGINTDEFSVTIEAISSVLDVQNTKFNGILLYPNPSASGNATIQLGENINGYVEVIDIHGKKITQQQVLGSNQIMLDLSHETTGLYLVIINDNKQNSAQLRFQKR